MFLKIIWQKILNGIWDWGWFKMAPGRARVRKPQAGLW